MPDVIIVHFDQIESEMIEKMAADAGFRSKITAAPQTAKEWIKISDFSAVFLHRYFPIKEQRELSSILWAGNPESTFVVFDLESGSEFEIGEARLLGAEVAAGPRAIAVLKEVFERLSQKRSLRSTDFRIMVVEDLDSPRYVISLYIENLGYSLVDGMSSAKEALEHLEGNPEKYSCVVTDIRMPGMDGKQLIDAIRRNAKLQHIPIIVLTAYGTTDALVGCLEAGASGFLVKPPKKADLMRELSRARRIAAKQANPRLANPDEVEMIRQILESRGLV